MNGSQSEVTREYGDLIVDWRVFTSTEKKSSIARTYATHVTGGILHRLLFAIFDDRDADFAINLMVDFVSSFHVRIYDRRVLLS